MAVSDLTQLLASMDPVLRAEPYVFTTGDRLPECPVVVCVVEDEGITAVVSQADADRLGLAYEFVAAMITLRVFSDLQAVGLTAAVASGLAEDAISCNVVAGFHHDHFFVGWDDRDRALEILRGLAQRKQASAC